jgi:TonB-dependent starch-binding outer membrane protein SusC
MLTKTLLVMKLTAILLFAACLEVSAGSNAQTVTLSLRNSSLERVFKEVKKQTGYGFIYTRELLASTGHVDVDVKNASLKEVLDGCFSGQPVTYTIEDRYIIVKPRVLLPPKLIDTAGPGNNGSKIKLLGRIMEVSGESLAGASITLRQPGQTSSVAGTTDANGGFRIMNIANGTYMLEVSFIGYEKLTRIVILTDKVQTLYLAMKRSTNTLDEIQTTAYSRTTVRFNTGDITTISSEEIARNPVDNVLDALQGRVAGMQIVSLNGELNGAFKVQFRSLNTLAGGETPSPQLEFNDVTGQPLYIVDGVEYPASGGLPMVGYMPGAGNNTLEGGNALNYLDPAQIESINVLKGVDATAIYGSRGAFGVILITTKRARSGKPSLSINVVQGISEDGPTPKLLNGRQYLALRHNAFANDGATPGTGDYDVNGVWDSTKSTNWQRYFIGGHAPKTRASAVYTGGSETTNFMIGANYSSTGNIELNKGSVSQGGMNFDLRTATANKKFVMDLHGSYSTNADDRVLVDFTAPNYLDQAPDAQAPYLPNGQLNWANGYNYAAILNGLYKNNTDNLLAGTTMTFTPIKGLSLIAAGAYSLISAKEFGGEPSTVFNPLTYVSTQSLSYLNTYSVRTLSADPRIQYNHVFWNKGVLEATAGGSLRDKLTTNETIEGFGFLSNELLLDPASATQTNTFTSYSTTPDRYLGAFAQVKYRWADKYLLDLNGRRDGSSLFGSARQWGNFGSASGGWIVSEEPWFKGLRHTVDFLKLRGSYGLVGANSLLPFSYLSLFQVSTGSYQGGNALTPGSLSNSYLHWETDKNAEGGVTVDLFNRLNVDVVYYSDHVSNQLGSQPLASITGFTQVSVNLPADIHTYGLEITIVSHNIHKKDFTWDTKLNYTAPRTKLLSYPGLGTLAGNYNWIIGKPITGVKLLKYAGVDPATGVYNFYDSAGVKGEYTPFLSPNQLSQSDKTAFVDLAPKFYGGILNSVTYKRFSMDFLISVTDRMGPNYLGFQSFPPGTFNMNFPADLAARRWMKPGDKTDVPKATQGILGFLDQNNFIYSTGAYSNATYARLQNISISYRFPASILRHAGASLISVYLSGQNILTVSKYGDLDPENMSAGHMGPARIFTGGLNVTF